jgi:molecular chaperone DnaJ
MTDRDRPNAGRDPYDTLGVGADATDEEITRAYRHLARAKHPDANPGATGDAFAGLTDAYDVLRDPDRRRRYDQTRDTRGAAAGAAAATRIPVRTSGRRRPPTSDDPPPAARFAEVDLELTFEQAALGTTATVTLNSDETCPACAGRGSSRTAGACPHCDGNGATVRVSGGINVRTACRRCGGTGQGVPTACTTCAGRGVATTSQQLTVRVPAGVEDGTRLRPASTMSDRVEAIVHVAAHPFFRRRGPDLTVRVPVTFAEAALGTVLTLPTLDGAVAIRVPAGTTHGRVLRVAGRGIAHPSRRGDLLATIEIDVPTALNDRQRSALEAYADATPLPRSHLAGHQRSASTKPPPDSDEGGP